MPVDDLCNFWNFKINQGKHDFTKPHSSEKSLYEMFNTTRLYIRGTNKNGPAFKLPVLPIRFLQIVTDSVAEVLTGNFFKPTN